MENLYQAMKKLKTEDEVTKRLLLVVHYMNLIAKNKLILP
jgi:hypothetical protein